MKVKAFSIGVLCLGSCAFGWLVVEGDKEDENKFMLEILLGLIGIRILFEKGE